MKAVDCEALAGSWNLGAVRAGFKIARRVALPGGFGNAAIEANRELLGEFPVETGPLSEWTPEWEVGLLFGTPPCSGWSVMNTSRGANARGANSAVQQCTWDLVRYAARCTGTDDEPGPEIVAFESVQQAFTQGRDLMSAYLKLLRDGTRQDYALTHVLMSGAGVGAAQLRSRYFFVAHRIPFGVDVVSPRVPVTYLEAIGDLRGLKVQRARQRLTRPAETLFQALARSPDATVDWHEMCADGSGETNLHLTMNVLRAAGRRWEVGMNQRDTVQALFDEGRLPERALKWIDDEGRVKGWGGPIKVDPDRPGRVIHGGGLSQFIHWEEDRWLTLRELARMMGYPDEWTFPMDAKINQIGPWIGKNCPVQAGQWLSTWAYAALEAAPGRLRGALDPKRDGETIINVTHAWKDPGRILAEEAW